MAGFITKIDEIPMKISLTVPGNLARGFVKIPLGDQALLNGDFGAINQVVCERQHGQIKADTGCGFHDGIGGLVWELYAFKLFVHLKVKSQMTWPKPQDFVDTHDVPSGYEWLGSVSSSLDGSSLRCLRCLSQAWQPELI